MRYIVALVVPLALTVACSGGDQQAASTPDSAAAAATAAPPVVTIVAKDFAFEVPDTVTGGMVTIKLLNQGSTLHHVQFLRLKDGKTFADFAEGMKAMKPGAPPPPWIEDVAGPNSPVPGGESALTQDLQPGNYAVVCFIDTPDKVPHFAKGMMHPLTVVAPTTIAAAPTADVTVSMTDYAWSISPGLTAGKHTIRLENAASQSHEMFIAKLDSGKTQADLMQWAQDYKGKPPATPMGGISGMATGGVAYLPVDLSAGEYVLICFLPDAKDGKPHLVHGMIKQLTVS